MAITFHAQVNEDDLFRFNMRHTYTSFSGIGSIVAGILIFTIAGVMHERLGTENVVLYCILATLFLLYTPIHLKLRAKTVMAMDSPLSRGMTFRLEDEGLAIETAVAGEDDQNQAFLPYQQIYRVSLTKQDLLIYTSRKNAYIVPRRDVEDQLDAIIEVFRSKLDSYRLSI